MKNILKKRLFEINEDERMNRSDTNEILEKVIIRKRIEYVDSAIAKMDTEVRPLVTDLWINKYSKTKTAERNKMSETGIYWKVEQELRKIL